MGYKENKVIEIRNVVDFDCDNIFDCGQCFRWEHNEDGSYTGIVNLPPEFDGGSTGVGIETTVEYDAGSKLLRISESGASEMPGTPEKAAAFSDENAALGFWRNYLDLDRDYGAIKTMLAKGDPVMEEAIEFGSGIRILKQDKWEATLSFIISQNNNIPRIKKCIGSVAELLGQPVGGGGFALPSAERLAAATVEDLAPCRLGYRAKYLVESAAQVCADGIPGDAEGLRGFCGVGPKVANCIDLFGLGNVDSFPVDVWMKRIMNQLYGIPENNVKAMQEYAAEHFAPYGGIAQQYLFYYITHRD